MHQFILIYDESASLSSDSGKFIIDLRKISENWISEKFVSDIPYYLDPNNNLRSEV